jgi:hypothetical protein
VAAEDGQAQIELVAAIGVLIVVAILGIRAAATIDAALVADAATHAGGLAQSAGGDGVAVARRALPKNARSKSRVRAAAGAVSVRFPPVRSVVWSRLPGG